MATQKSFGKRVLANLKTKTGQLLLCMALFGGVVWVSAKLLGPKDAPKVGQATDEYKYLVCNECKLEVLYNREMDRHTCPKCQPPKVGYLMPSKTSVKSGGDGNPWRRYNIAVGVEFIVFLMVIVYLLSRPVADVPTDYILNCLHCGLALRYQPDGFDQYALCPGCDQVIKLPDEEEAMTQEDQEDVKEANILTTMEADLRGSGHIVDPTEEDGEENPAEPHHDAPAGG